MRYLNIGFIFCQITVLSQAEKFGIHLQHEPKKSDEREILQVLETRYRSNPDYPERDFRNYNNRIARKEFDLPVTFKAPHYEAHDYWRNQQGYENRRTFFDDYSYRIHDKATTFPSFYRLMSSIFGGRDEDTPQPPDGYHHPRNPVTPPYSYDLLFNFRPTEPNYIPPPKPIRASVIKLETITRSPMYPSFEYEVTPKYYPHPGSILNQVLIENSKAQQNLDFYRQEPKISPPFKPLSVLPKPSHIPITTLNPIHPNNYKQSLFKYYNKTDLKYPKSVQDQIPNFNLENVKIPYVSENPIPQIFNTVSTEPSVQESSTYGRDFSSPSYSGATTNIFGLIDIRSTHSPGGNEDEQERLEFDARKIKSFPGAVEKVKKPSFKFTKKVTTQVDKSSVERIANLTVQGISKSFQKRLNYLNVRDLNNYEMGRVEGISHTVLEPKQTAGNDSSKRPVNLNDELSLDAKILKDTNWDGLTIHPTFPTMEEPKETTTFLIIQSNETKPTRNKTAFWEIAEEQSTISPTTLEITTEASTATEQSKIPTTTELFPSSSTAEVTETSEFTIKEETSEIPRKTAEEDLRQSKIQIYQTMTEPPEMIASTTKSERITLARRYSRRPKIMNFTPYPTAEEIQKKIINRNHFSKRQKPNITLAFGNKNVLKPRNNFGKDELMKFSDEDLRKRRKTGKRRQVFKRIRTTSERSLQNA